jgi:hypothetical protein
MCPVCGGTGYDNDDLRSNGIDPSDL